MKHAALSRPREAQNDSFYILVVLQCILRECRFYGTVCALQDVSDEICFFETILFPCETYRINSFPYFTDAKNPVPFKCQAIIVCLPRTTSTTKERREGKGMRTLP